MTIETIISGGQSGADRGGLLAAMAEGIETRGYCPKGRRAEDGRIPDLYPLMETPSSDYPQRTEWNVRDSDGTIIFCMGALGRGSTLTLRYAQKYGKPHLVVDLAKRPEDTVALEVVNFMQKHELKILNVAGGRESRSPGLQKRVQTVMEKALKMLKACSLLKKETS